MDTAADSAALATARRAVRAGGEVARRRLGDPGYLRWKGPRDVVSEAALEVQAAIVAAIEADSPGAAILAREGPDDAALPVGAEPLWIVNPICGALNFAQGIPFFATSIAWRSKGAIRTAAVYDPIRDEMFDATIDGVATVNRQAMHVQQIAEGAEAWAAAVLGTDWPTGDDRRRRASHVVDLVVDQVNACSVLGSPSLGLCYVAAGRLHGYFHLDLTIWEVAASSLILQRAGGFLTDARGMSWLHSDGGYLASNAVVHTSLLNCVQAGLAG